MTNRRSDGSAAEVPVENRATDNARLNDMFHEVADEVALNAVIKRAHVKVKESEKFIAKWIDTGYTVCREAGKPAYPTTIPTNPSWALHASEKGNDEIQMQIDADEEWLQRDQQRHMDFQLELRKRMSNRITKQRALESAKIRKKLASTTRSALMDVLKQWECQNQVMKSKEAEVVTDSSERRDGRVGGESQSGTTEQERPAGEENEDEDEDEEEEEEEAEEEEEVEREEIGPEDEEEEDQPATATRKTKSRQVTEKPQQKSKDRSAMGSVINTKTGRSKMRTGAGV